LSLVGPFTNAKPSCGVFSSRFVSLHIMPRVQEDQEEELGAALPVPELQGAAGQGQGQGGTLEEEEAPNMGMGMGMSGGEELQSQFAGGERGRGNSFRGQEEDEGGEEQMPPQLVPELGSGAPMRLGAMSATVDHSTPEGESTQCCLSMDTCVRVCVCV
jgi:hypothetical protein